MHYQICLLWNLGTSESFSGILSQFMTVCLKQVVQDYKNINIHCGPLQLKTQS